MEKETKRLSDNTAQRTSPRSKNIKSDVKPLHVDIETPKLIRGNALEELKTIPDESIDLIFADPPYWMRVEGVLQRVEGSDFDGCNDEWDNQFEDQDDYKIFTTRWLTECKRVLSKDGSLWVIGGMQCIYTIGGIMQDLGFWFLNDVIWHKTNPTPNFSGSRLNNSHETLLWASKSKKSKCTFNYKTAKELNKEFFSEGDWAKGLRKQMGSVWRFGVCQGKERLRNARGEKLHSTQKPEKLLHRVLSISSKVGDVVLDPFAGTMTTGVVARQLGRSVVMLEQSEEYFAAGATRIDHTLPFFDDITLASFDVKPPRVKFSDMIADRYFHEEELLYFKPVKNTTKGTAVLKSTGNVEYKGELRDIHTVAGWVKNGGQRQNGWDYWYVKRNDEYVSIDAIRKHYRNEKLGYFPLENREKIYKKNPLTHAECISLLEAHFQQGKSLAEFCSDMLPRLLTHAGTLVLDSSYTPYLEQFLLLKPNGRRIHLCHIRALEHDQIWPLYEERCQSWSETVNATLMYRVEEAVLDACEATIPSRLNNGIEWVSGKSLFTILNRECIWNIFQAWIKEWEETWDPREVERSMNVQKGKSLQLPLDFS